MERRLTAGAGLLTRIMLGPGELLAQGLNVLLTAASGGFLFLLGRRWWGLPAGITAYLLWIACPSQTIYNSLILSEPLYTALTLGVLVLLTAEEGKRPIVQGVAAGLALRWCNGVRPIAAVVIIALVLWRVLLKPEEWLLEEAAGTGWDCWPPCWRSMPSPARCGRLT